MPIHDWTRIDAGIYHGFHLRWIGRLTEALNTGGLPPEFYAEIERPADGLLNHIAIRHLPAHRLASVVEVVSPMNKSSRDGVGRFVSNARRLIEQGTHVTTIDLFPSTRFAPDGLHALVRRNPERAAPASPPDKPFVLATYNSAPEPELYLDFLGVGDELPAFHTFLTHTHYVNLPLSDTYAAAFAASPSYLQELLTTPGA